MAPGRPGGVVGGDVGRRGELVPRGFDGGGEAGPVRVGPRAGFHRVHHGHPQQLVDGEQGPDLLLQAGPVTRAQGMTVQQGVPQGEVGGFDLPPLVVQADQGGSGIAAVVRQRGDQPVGVLDTAAVGAGDGQVRFDDPHL